MTNKDSMYDWLFHYNHYTNLWNTFRREDVQDYFNGTLENVISSKKQSTLIEILDKTKGDLNEIEKLLTSGK